MKALGHIDFNTYDYRANPVETMKDIQAVLNRYLEGIHSGMVRLHVVAGGATEFSPDFDPRKPERYFILGDMEEK